LNRLKKRIRRQEKSAYMWGRVSASSAEKYVFNSPRSPAFSDWVALAGASSFPMLGLGNCVGSGPVFAFSSPQISVD
jgi:hypothetical protein